MDRIEKGFKPMECPVCHSFYFSKPNKQIEQEELEEYMNGEVFCTQCGWIYDLNQAENQDCKEGFNDLSVNEYRKEYNDKLSHNPDYNYLNEICPDPKPHKCPVCGEYEFEDVYSHDICPVCGWEDTGFEEFPDERPGLFMCSLNENIDFFKKQRSINPKFKNDNAHKKKNLNPHKCPVCKEWEFDFDYSYRICPICGWLDSGFEKTPDKKASVECMTFNEHLADFKKKREDDPNYTLRGEIPSYDDDEDDEYEEDAGIATTHINYPFAWGFDEDRIKLCFKKHAPLLKIKDIDEYEQQSIKFANEIDRENYVSFVDNKTGNTFKYSKTDNKLVIVALDGLILDYLRLTENKEDGFEYFKKLFSKNINGGIR